ncbi:MAG TPA: NF038129 family PEP-CTERM protein [Gemmataceae bacterium]|nr:NF038129 family PEP-CTERM protein [Gemmataceae bacterium]
MLVALRQHAWVWAAVAAWVLAPSAGRAGFVTYQVTFPDTTSLKNQPGQGPYYLDFQFTDGGGPGDANNTVVISHLALGGGALVGAGAPSGGVTGDLSSAVTMTDSAFFNEFSQQFTPGSSLAFQVSLSQTIGPGEDSASGGTPDEFSFAILHGAARDEIATTNFNDAFVTIDVTSPSLTVTPAGSAAGSGFDVPAPSVVPSAAAAPEPAALWLFALGAGGLGALRWPRGRAS